MTTAEKAISIVEAFERKGKAVLRVKIEGKSITIELHDNNAQSVAAVDLVDLSR